MKYINLRPHHFLCIPGYKGYGYSREFEVNMEKVIKSLNQGVNAKVTLENDDICKFCLNPQNNVCSNHFTQNIDLKVMNILGLKEGEFVDFQEKLDVLKTVLTPKIHKEICGECIWMKKGFCSDTFE